MGVLAGCDNSPAPDPLGEARALVGTWAAEAEVRSRLLTVQQAADIVDLARPGVGELRYSGAATGVLVFPGTWDSDGELGRFYVYASSPLFQPLRSPATVATLGDTRASLQVHDGSTWQFFSASYATPPFTYAGRRLRLAPTTLASETGQFVVLEGTFEPSMRGLPAGQEVEVNVRRIALQTDLSMKTRFDAGGGFRQVRYQAGDSSETVGAWTPETAGGVRLTGTTAGQGWTVAKRTAWMDGGLVFGDVTDACPNVSTQAACLASYDALYGLSAGTLRRVRQHSGWLLRRMIP